MTEEYKPLAYWHMVEAARKAAEAARAAGQPDKIVRLSAFRAAEEVQRTGEID